MNVGNAQLTVSPRKCVGFYNELQPSDSGNYLRSILEGLRKFSDTKRTSRQINISTSQFKLISRPDVKYFDEYFF